MIHSIPVHPEYPKRDAKDKHSQHEGRLSVESNIYPSSDIHEHERRDNYYETPGADLQDIIHRFYVFLVFNKFFHNYLLIPAYLGRDMNPVPK